MGKRLKESTGLIPGSNDYIVPMKAKKQKRHLCAQYFNALVNKDAELITSWVSWCISKKGASKKEKKGEQEGDGWMALVWSCRRRLLVPKLSSKHSLVERAWVASAGQGILD